MNIYVIYNENYISAYIAFITLQVYIYIIFLAETTNYGLKKRVGNTVDATEYKTDIGRILIVSTGSIVSLVLISIIVRETYKYRQFSRTPSL